MCIDAALFESQSTSNLFRHPGCSVAPGWTLVTKLQKRYEQDCPYNNHVSINAPMVIGQSQPSEYCLYLMVLVFHRRIIQFEVSTRSSVIVLLLLPRDLHQTFPRSQPS